MCNVARNVTQVLKETIVTGTAAAITTVSYVQHAGASFSAGSWAPTSTSQIIYIDSVVQV